jgi:hypothetical protein
VAQEGGLGENLYVEKRGRRLELDGSELLTPVELTWRMDIQERHGEDDAARHRCQAPRPARPKRPLPPADRVVAAIDRG